MCEQGRPNVKAAVQTCQACLLLQRTGMMVHAQEDPIKLKSAEAT